MNRRFVATFIGFTMGFFVLHPISMLFQGLIHPGIVLNFNRLQDAFSIHHLPMAFFFGVLGAIFGFVVIRYTLLLSTQKKRVSMLESLLPICASCKKIRDDSGDVKGKGEWVRVDHYIASKTDTTFTHGMCPECYEKTMQEIEELDRAEAAHAGDSVINKA